MGGFAGHMKHMYEYVELSKYEISDFINDLFDGKVTSITEKMDGFNIYATMNLQNQVVFIRNKSDLNSENTGMTISELEEKWKDNPNKLKIFLSAAKIIESEFKQLGKWFFNYLNSTDNRWRLKLINCECIYGKTNVIRYVGCKVFFHNISEYMFYDGQYTHIQDRYFMPFELDELTIRLHITPTISIKPSIELKNKYQERLNEIFEKNLTIREWRYDRFYEYIDQYYPQLFSGRYDLLYNRWFNGDKTFNIREIKKTYPGLESEIDNFDKVISKSIIQYVYEPLDTFFLMLGNDVIDKCIEQHNNLVQDEIKSDLKVIINNIINSNDDKLMDKLIYQLERLKKLNGQINSIEGLVVHYNDMIFKLTGSFAPINQIMGMRFQLK